MTQIKQSSASGHSARIQTKSISGIITLYLHGCDCGFRLKLQADLALQSAGVLKPTVGLSGPRLCYILHETINFRTISHYVTVRVVTVC